MLCMHCRQPVRRLRIEQHSEDDISVWCDNGNCKLFLGLIPAAALGLLLDEPPPVPGQGGAKRAG